MFNNNKSSQIKVKYNKIHKILIILKFNNWIMLLLSLNNNNNNKWIVKFKMNQFNKLMKLNKLK